MDDGTWFVGIAALLVVGLAWLAAYLYGLYVLGGYLGRRFRPRRHPRLAYAWIVASATALASLAALVPIDRLGRFCVALVIWFAHVHPVAVGYWLAQDAARRKEERDCWKRTDEWLSQWEISQKE